MTDGFGTKKVVSELPEVILNELPHQTQTVKSSVKEKLQEEFYNTYSIHLSQSLEIYRNQVFELLINQIDLATASKMDHTKLRQEVERFIQDFSSEYHARVSYQEQQQVIDTIVNDMVGLGPLEILLQDKSVNDILVNAFDKVYVERYGKLYKTDVVFRNERHVIQMAQRIANSIGRRIDESSPLVDARLKDGSRVNIIVPPLALDGASISIRKFSETSLSIQDMINNKNISEPVGALLKIAAQGRLNIIVAGGTGAGKTTLLNALSQLVNPQERIVTIEDAAELKLGQPHIVRLESRPANIEGKGEILIRDLLRNALRMRPDRIIIGECRGAEAFDMLQAMNTGHDGSMSTIHANSAGEALSRMENMLMMTGNNLPASVLRTYIADAIDLVIHVSRMRDGKRRITQITEVRGITDGHIDISDIFKFHYLYESEDHKLNGEYRCLDTHPHILEKLKIYELDKALEAHLNTKSD